MNGVSVVVVKLLVFKNLKSGTGQPIEASIVLNEIKIVIQKIGKEKKEAKTPKMS